jgi:hypothetical protein
VLNRIRQLLSGTQSLPQIANERLIPDPERVVASFDFRLGSLQRGASFAEAAKSRESAVRAELERRGITKHAGIPLDSPEIEYLYRQLKKIKESGRFQVTGEFSFRLHAGARPGWEWFEIRARAHSPIDVVVWACRADRMPAGKNWLQYNYLTERSKRIVEEAGLTGLDFVWVRDAGRYQAEQWHRAIATKPLGRGLDHPFFDPTKLVQPDYVKRWATFEEWRFGIFSLKKSEFLPNARFDISVLDSLAELCEPGGLAVKGFRQMLREFIPPMDFAYVWGHELPILCCNARARDVLLEHQLLAPNEFAPVWVWDKAPKGATVLDGAEQKCVLPYPLELTRWKQLQEQLRLHRESFLAHPKPKCVTTAAKVLERFRASQKPKPSRTHAAPQVTPAAAIPCLPKLWDQVLDLADDFFVLLETDESAKGRSPYEVVSRSKLAEFYKMTEESARFAMPGFPKNLTHFAHDGMECWLAFDLDTLTPEGDCRVLKLSHDTYCVVHEWPSIVQLLEESLDLAETEERSEDPE